MRNSNYPRTQRPRHRQVIFSIDILKAAFTEFILTFIFVFAGTGSRIAVRNLNLTGDDATFGLIATAIAHAFALSAVVWIGVKNNGGNPYTLCGHVNPAVTFGAFMGGNIHIFRGLVYCIAQLLASIGACSLLMFVTGGQSVPIFGLSNGVGVENALVFEMVMTLGLVFTMCATIFDPKAKGYNSTINSMINGQDVQKLIKMPPLNKIAPLAIGLIFGANILVGGPFDGASMNPALSFGPAVVTWSWGNHWVYWVGPLIGGGLAGFTYDFVFINN